MDKSDKQNWYDIDRSDSNSPGEGWLDSLPLRASTLTLSLFITQQSKGVRSFRLRPSNEALLRARVPGAKKAPRTLTSQLFKRDSARRTREL
jgi:hypothetical protein